MLRSATTEVFEAVSFDGSWCVLDMCPNLPGDSGDVATERQHKANLGDRWRC